ncbi:inorganic phosphate transporter [Mesorhizobium sp. M1076]
MVDIVSSEAGIPRPEHPLDRPNGTGKWFLPAFAVIILGGLAYVGYALSQDLTSTVAVPWILLGLALLIALGFEFVNGFLTYGQGASAELVAMATIASADYLGLPVSTTHVLSSGVAGTMAANGSGLQWSTVRNMLMAWILTLPVSICLAFVLFVIFRQVF